MASWEAVDTVPSGETLHAVAFALGATPEEACALACARGVPSGRLPDAPYTDFTALRVDLGPRLGQDTPPELREVVALGLQSELWTRAAKDARWDAPLASSPGP